MIETLDRLVAAIDLTLKDFQAATVAYVLDQFYVHDRKKILVADEVGLGKTIIAKGVLIKALRANYQPGRTFNVIYVCSNQVLAQQNMKKLNPFAENPDPYSRLTYLAFKRADTQLPLRLSSLTPATSFNITRSAGTKVERAILLGLLCHYAFFRDHGQQVIALFRGSRQIGEVKWKNLAHEYIRAGASKFRDQLPRLFKLHLEQVEMSAARFPGICRYIGAASGLDAWSGLKKLFTKLGKDGNTDPLLFSYELVRALRFELTQVCVQFMDADLFILDEFQRFKTLLDGEDHTEAGEIAKKVLQDEQARVLLLSATPFKSFTTKLEELSNENHFDEFRKLVLFLGGARGESLWAEIKKDQEAFFQVLRFPRDAMDDLGNARATKNRLQQKMKSVMTRNERMSVADDQDGLVMHNTQNQLKIIAEDVRNFIAVDQVTETLKDIMTRKGKFSGSTLEFSKSTPYPLSYLRGYNLRHILEQYKQHPEIIRLLNKSKDAFIDFQKINRYEPIGMSNGRQAYPNGKLRVLADECFEHNGHLLLWVPPSKAYCQPFGAYAKADHFSKILVFSGWVMVPRAVSTLLSYEAERLTIGKANRTPNTSKERRSYFTEEQKRQKPLITFPLGANKMRMAHLCLAYPSRWLRDALDVKSLVNQEGRSFAAVKKDAARSLARKIKALGIAGKYCQTSQADERWYWLLPALLDRLHGYDQLLDIIIKHTKGGRQQHYILLKETVDAVFHQRLKGLGSFPADLYEILAEMALCSPANVAYRLFNEYFKDKPYHAHCAYYVSHAFITLFNKPESIAVVRLTTPGQPYWRQVLQYCAAGNFQAMLEEFFYLLRDCENMQTSQDVRQAIENILSVKATHVQVDDKKAFFDGKPKDMRCHFAISYGDQKMSTEAGNDRMVNVREVFNSPFRPFVLTSTSIGQEGLDFHYYCRKIVHWNLPHNPIDLEQREGRINRYKGFVIRQSLAAQLPLEELVGADKPLWETLFALAESRVKKPGESDLVPFWYLNESKYKIERLVPIHEFSRDEARFERIKETLALYRLTFGQPRQEELVEAFRNSDLSPEEISLIRKTLLINLSPLIKEES